MIKALEKKDKVVACLPCIAVQLDLDEPKGVKRHPVARVYCGPISGVAVILLYLLQVAKFLTSSFTLMLIPGTMMRISL